MTDAVIATRATITIGPLSVDGFMLPDGSYRMSQTQVAECIKDDRIYARRFLDSRALKSLAGKGYTPDTFEVDPSEQVRGQTRFQGWPLDIVYAFWVYRCHKGNKDAFRLVIALGTESLERRFDSAFGVERSEDDRNAQISNRIDRLTQDLEKLGEAYAVDDDIRRENAELRSYIKEQGLPGPYTLEDRE